MRMREEQTEIRVSGTPPRTNHTGTGEGGGAQLHNFFKGTEAVGGGEGRLFSALVHVAGLIFNTYVTSGAENDKAHPNVLAISPTNSGILLLNLLARTCDLFCFVFLGARNAYVPAG